MNQEHYACKNCSKDLTAVTLSGRVQHVKRCSLTAAADTAPQLQIQDIRSWLKALHLEKHADAFEREEVELTHLSTLSDLDLQSLGVGDAESRRVILMSATTVGGELCLLGPTYLPLQPLENCSGTWQRLLQPPPIDGKGLSSPCAPAQTLQHPAARKAKSAPKVAAGNIPAPISASQQLTLTWVNSTPNSAPVTQSGSGHLALAPLKPKPPSGEVAVTLRELAAARIDRPADATVSPDSVDTDAGASIRAIEKQLLGWCYPPAPRTLESFHQTPLPVHHWSGNTFCEDVLPFGARRVLPESALWAHSATCTRPADLATFQQRHKVRQSAAAAAKAAAALDAEAHRHRLVAAAAQTVQIDLTGDEPVEAFSVVGDGTSGAGRSAQVPHHLQPRQQHQRRRAVPNSLQSLQVEALREELAAAEAVVADLRKNLRDAERAAGLHESH